jgi:hypothetical protein
VFVLDIVLNFIYKQSLEKEFIGSTVLILKLDHRHDTVLFQSDSTGLWAGQLGF